MLFIGTQLSNLYTAVDTIVEDMCYEGRRVEWTSLQQAFFGVDDPVLLFASLKPKRCYFGPQKGGSKYLLPSCIVYRQ